MSIQYKIPEYVHVSQDCKQLLASIFVANPAKVLFGLNSGQLTGAIHRRLILFSTIISENNNEGDQEPPLVLEELAKRAHGSCPSNVLQERQQRPDLLGPVRGGDHEDRGGGAETASFHHSGGGF
uniref:Uncharacterized protein n=1 Tax=Aegilops tauschii subsp. strangulata TaxID=200361 RepID=A0A453BZW0_AEGTS